MTINKSQGQSVEHVGILVLFPEQSQESRRILNVVYKEVFNSIRLQIVYVYDNGLEIDFSYNLRDKEMSQKENPHRLLEEESIATFQTTLSAIPQTVVGRKHNGLTSTQTLQARLEAWMKTLSSMYVRLMWDDATDKPCT